MFELSLSDDTIFFTIRQWGDLTPPTLLGVKCVIFYAQYFCFLYYAIANCAHKMSIKILSTFDLKWVIWSLHGKKFYKIIFCFIDIHLGCMNSNWNRSDSVSPIYSDIYKMLIWHFISHNSISKTIAMGRRQPAYVVCV